MNKPILLHLGDDIKWNHDLYQTLSSRFESRRSYSIARSEFISALKSKQYGDYVAMYRPFWNTGGEMGKWDEELINLLPELQDLRFRRCGIRLGGHRDTDEKGYKGAQAEQTLAKRLT